MIVNKAQPSSERLAGSFRDPSGYVFCRQGRIGRAIDEGDYQTLRALDAGGLLGRLIERRLIVGTRFVEDRDEVAALAAEHPGFARFLEHDRIAPITYPYEWCLSMLADAGLQTLALQGELLRAGFSLKDATAYNLQFVGA